MNSGGASAVHFFDKVDGCIAPLLHPFQTFLLALHNTRPLLLDEVAAHLDAARRAALYDEVCTLGAQAWMTGTGPELFTDLGARAQYVEVTETGCESRTEQEVSTP